MFGMFNSRVRVERPTTSKVGGRSQTKWSAVAGLESVPCRLDLQLMRLGDIQPAVVAGKAPDRSGVLFCADTVPLKAGDRLVTVPGPGGNLPVEGVFEIRSIPDRISGYSITHHIEVQIWETNRDLDSLWPNEA